MESCEGKKRGTNISERVTLNKNLPEDERQLCRYIAVSRNSRTSWVHPFSFHIFNINRCCGQAKDRIAALQSLKLELSEITHVSPRELTSAITESLSEYLGQLFECLLSMIGDCECEHLSIQCIKSLFQVSNPILDEEPLKIFTHCISANNRKVTKTLCNNLLDMLPKEAFTLAHPTQEFISICTDLIEMVLHSGNEKVFCAVIERLDPSVSSAVLESLRVNSQNLYRKAWLYNKSLVDQLSGTKSSYCDLTWTPKEIEDNAHLLWNRFANDFESVSFVLSGTLFESINLLSNGNLSGNTAHSVALEVTNRIEHHICQCISVVEANKRIMLVKTPQLTVICAITELFLMNSHFNLILLGLNSFTNVIEIISEQKPRNISESDYNTLFVNQGENGYCWVIRLAISFLRIALPDSKLAIRTAGSQLALVLFRLPGGPMALIRGLVAPVLSSNDNTSEVSSGAASRLRREVIDLATSALLLRPSSEFDFHEIIEWVILPGLLDRKKVVYEAAVDCLTVSVSILGDSLLTFVESKLPAADRNNNNEESSPESPAGFALRETIRLAVLRRQLPSLDNQGRLDRGDSNRSEVDSIGRMSALGQVSYDASPLGERRKPSAGRMHGNLRLPWDPRESVVVVGNSSGPSPLTTASSPFSLPNLSQTCVTPLGSAAAGSRRRFDNSAISSNRPSEICDLNTHLEQPQLRRSLNAFADSCDQGHRAIESQERASFEAVGIRSVRTLSGSLANLQSSPGADAINSHKAAQANDAAEVFGIRRKASQRRALRSNTDLEPTSWRLSDQFDSDSSANYRLMNRFNGRSNQRALTTPIMPSSLSTGRITVATHHQSQKPRSKGSFGPTDPHSPLLGPLRGQLEHAKRSTTRAPEETEDPHIDIIGKGIHPNAKQITTNSPRDSPEEPNDDNQVSGRTTVLAKLSLRTSDEVESDDESTIRANMNVLAEAGLAHRKDPVLQEEGAKEVPIQGEKKDEGEHVPPPRSCPRTPSRASSTQRPTAGLQRRPPTGPRDGSPHIRSAQHPSPDVGNSETAFSRPSRPPTTVESGRRHQADGDVTCALNQIASSDWEDKVNGLLKVSDLALRNPSVFYNSPENQSGVIQAVLTESKNLRSQVSRQAVKTLSDLFRGLGRLLDPHVDLCVRILLAKAGEASAAFLRGEVAIALNDLTRYANPNRALIALFQHGLGHKNAAVRRQCAIQASYIIESLGPSRVIQASSARGTLSSWGSTSAVGGGGSGTTAVLSSASSMAITERVIVALGKFLLDSNQETRYYGRRILSTLQKSPDFEGAVTRYLSGQSLRAVREATEYLHTKGLGEPPVVMASASCPRTSNSERAANSLQNRGCSAGSLGAGGSVL
uniref:CLASP_N domain-containing protein n=2 Tax=Mesocestoides corti TaxID=53468 RepID=A0A5K3EPA4_MESCO